jgi:hypothetical protein
MEDLGFVGAYIFGFLLNMALTPFIMGAGLVLLVRFGLLPRLLDQSKKTTDEKKQVVGRATRVILWTGLAGMILTLLLCCNLELAGELWDLVDRAVSEAVRYTISTVLFGEVRIAIVVEEWLALIGFFGLCYVSNRLGLTADRRQKISRYFANTLLVVGIGTVLGGIAWSVYTYTTPLRWYNIQEASFITGVALSPFTGFLTLGMLVMLVISLIQATQLQQCNEQHEHLARRMTLALLITFVLLSAAGGIWSAYIYRLSERGRLF